MVTDSLGFQQNDKQIKEQSNPTEMIVMSQNSKQKKDGKPVDESLAIFNESKDLQQAIEASLLKENDYDNNIISLEPRSNDFNGTKSRSRKRSKQRGIIDDDEEEEADDVALDAQNVMNENKAGMFGSDDQNYNQNNIDFDQGGLELKLNRDALYDVDDKELEKGKKSVEIGNSSGHFDLNGGSNNNKRKRGRPKKNSSQGQNSSQHLIKKAIANELDQCQNNPYVELQTDN